jgi:hypothetical protein
LLVEHGELPVEHECASEELGDRGCQVGEPARVVPPVPAYQADAVTVLIGQHPPAVDFFLVHSVVAVERLADERGGHGRVPRNHEPSFNLAGPLPAVVPGFVAIKMTPSHARTGSSRSFSSS